MIIRHPTENRTWEAQKPCVFATSFDNQEAKKKLTLVSRLKRGQKECFTKHPCQWNFKKWAATNSCGSNDNHRTFEPVKTWLFSKLCENMLGRKWKNEHPSADPGILYTYVLVFWRYQTKKKKTLKKGDVLSLHHTKDHEDLLGTIGIALFQCTPLFPCNASREHLSLRFLQKVVSLLEKFCGAFLKVVFSLSVTGWFETYSYKKTGMLN